MADLHNWLQAQLAKLSRNHDLAKAINYMLRRWPAFTLFLDDGRVCLSNNAAERALRCVPLGRCHVDLKWLTAVGEISAGCD